MEISLKHFHSESIRDEIGSLSYAAYQQSNSFTSAHPSLSRKAGYISSAVSDLVFLCHCFYSDRKIIAFITKRAAKLFHSYFPESQKNDQNRRRKKNRCCGKFHHFVNLYFFILHFNGCSLFFLYLAAKVLNKICN